jgi:spore germination protein GerM
LVRTGVAVSLAGVVLALTLAACALPSDDAYRPIEGDLPFGLADTTTTSTTTTTLPEATTTTVQPTTTTAPTTEMVDVYFVAGSSLEPVEREGPPDVTLAQVLSLLQTPPGPDETGLRTSIPSGAISGATVARGKATVDLTPSALSQAGNEQLFQIAQIVLTLTGRPGIGQVDFRVPGPGGVLAPTNVPRGNGALAPVVTREDYLNLVSPSA